jgi:hypothetical protein
MRLLDKLAVYHVLNARERINLTLTGLSWVCNLPVIRVHKQ